MTHDEMVEVLHSLKPGAEWALSGTVLRWDDEVQTEPTQQEIDDEFAVLYP